MQVSRPGRAMRSPDWDLSLSQTLAMSEECPEPRYGTHTFTPGPFADLNGGLWPGRGNCETPLPPQEKANVADFSRRDIAHKSVKDSSGLQMDLELTKRRMCLRWVYRGRFLWLVPRQGMSSCATSGQQRSCTSRSNTLHEQCGHVTSQKWHSEQFGHIRSESWPSEQIGQIQSETGHCEEFGHITSGISPSEQSGHPKSAIRHCLQFGHIMSGTRHCRQRGHPISATRHWLQFGHIQPQIRPPRQIGHIIFETTSSEIPTSTNPRANKAMTSHASSKSSPLSNHSSTTQ
jgi:hypothetical protein